MVEEEAQEEEGRVESVANGAAVELTKDEAEEEEEEEAV